MKLKNLFILLLAMLISFSCDKDEYFDEFEVDITLSGDISKFRGNLNLLSYDGEDGALLFSSRDGRASNDGLGNYAVQFWDTSPYEFYTGTYIDEIRVSYSFYGLTLEALEDAADNGTEYTLSVAVTVRRNGSQIDSFTVSYDQDTDADEGFEKTYSIN
ncbi:hypothetical protein [Flagellimonas algicola]|uniref:Uncharacterized protein n=1 Tax=Flagellimonas algicola TaxID=2583815 RepID=A0ABY2WQ27_9FLAO|nr:hypothetical protein [Allomuricauda algicola]TMU56855.1 hypothetical protein FGG15_04730 [Allomuricauda algicola]